MIVTMTETKQSYRRPRMPVTRDTAFWLEGAAVGELRIQRCAKCATLRHPPRPMCPVCNSLEWDTLTSAGKGTIYSYVVYHHQAATGLPVPYAVLVVELDEGVRVVGNLVEADPNDARVGMPVEVVFVADPRDDLVLPQWRPHDATKDDD
jgi:uncharacterized OB-fold protein